eukprot:TRINITY_DN63128_c0_g1_i2.p1 TRINITY_DN63128_c0_g1~~TRINITY_DN63128_c0_g1_i2.p1  ORF type:complete len:818 (-),score=216.62 TRINITY_DN63128_c0_g1_i2:1171-3624(-)
MGNSHAKHVERDPDSLFEQDITTLLEWLRHPSIRASVVSDKKENKDDDGENPNNLPPPPHAAAAPQPKPGKAIINKHGYTDAEIVTGLGQKLYDTEVSMEAIFNAIEFEPLRKIRDLKPEVFYACVEVIVEKLEGVVVTGVVEKDDKRLPLVLNCLRATARFIVVANEDYEGKAQELLWSRSEAPVVENPKDQDSDDVGQYCLARRLLCALANLLFVPGFTIVAADPSAASAGTTSADPLSFLDDSRNLVWERQGDKISFDVVNTLDGNRVEVLRALLACLSQDLFVTTDAYTHERNVWIKAFCQTSAYPSLRPRISVSSAVVRPLVRPSTIFWSLFNVMLNFNPNPKVKGFVAMLPNTLTDISSREILLTMSVHLLLVFLEFRRLNVGDEKNDDEEFVNYYLKCFRDIRRPKDLELVFEGITRLLAVNIFVAAQVVQTGLRQLEIYDEIVIITWKLVDENRAFHKLVLNSPSSPDLIKPILFYMYKCKEDPSKAGLLHACALTLLRLSAERDFSVALNAKYEPALPIDVPKIENATIADLLIIVVHKLIISQLDHLESLFHVLLTILQNISPYMTRLTMYSSVRLMNLFELMSSPSFLTASLSNYSFIIFLLDIFNNLIQYQYNGSSRLVYCMLRRANLFYDLVSLDAPTLNKLALESPGRGAAAPQQFVKGSKGDSFEDEEIAAKKAIRNQVVVEVTPEFVSGWKEKLHTKAIFALLEYLIPRLKNLAEDRSLDNEEAVLALIERTTVVGILPAPHSIVVRRYTNTPYTMVWFTTYIWGLVFLRNERPVLFDPPRIKLFVCGYVEPEKKDDNAKD